MNKKSLQLFLPLILILAFAVSVVGAEPEVNLGVCATLQPPVRAAGGGEWIRYELRDSGVVEYSGTAQTDENGCFDVVGVPGNFNVFVQGDYANANGNGDVLGAESALVSLDTMSDTDLGITLVEGDANDTNTVRSSDFSIWQSQNGQNGDGLESDFNETDSVRSSDFAIWQNSNGANGGTRVLTVNTINDIAGADALKTSPATLDVNVGESASMTVVGDFSSGPYSTIQVEMTYDDSVISISNLAGAGGNIVVSDLSAAGLIRVTLQSTANAADVDLITFDVTALTARSRADAMLAFAPYDALDENGSHAFAAANPFTAEEFATLTNPTVTTVDPTSVALSNIGTDVNTGIAQVLLPLFILVGIAATLVVQRKNSQI